MFASRVSTLDVPVIPALTGESPAPAAIIKDAGRDCVVRVRNNSFGVYVIVANDPATLQNQPSRLNTWKLPAGAVDAFILARGQSLYVSASSRQMDGEPPEISYHVYEELPVVVG